MSRSITISIKIKDVLGKQAKKKVEGFVDIVTVPNGVPYLLRFSDKDYEYIQKRVSIPDAVLLLTGQNKIIVSKTEKPWIFIEVEDVHRLKASTNRKEIIKAKIITSNKKNKTDEPQKNWFEEVGKEKLKLMNPSDIELIEEVHLNAVCYINFKSFNRAKEIYPIAAREVDGKLYLVSGFSRYIYCKIFNKPVEVFITDLDKKEFDEKYHVRRY